MDDDVPSRLSRSVEVDRDQRRLRAFRLEDPLGVEGDHERGTVLQVRVEVPPLVAPGTPGRSNPILPRFHRGTTKTETGVIGILVPQAGESRESHATTSGGARPSAWRLISRSATRVVRVWAMHCAPTRARSRRSTSSIADRAARPALWPRSVNDSTTGRRSVGSRSRSRYPRTTRVSTAWLTACLVTPSHRITDSSEAPLHSIAFRRYSPHAGTSPQPTLAWARRTAAVYVPRIACSSAGSGTSS